MYRHLLIAAALAFVAQSTSAQRSRVPNAHRDADQANASHTGTARGTGPVNDNCADAIAITVHPFGSCPAMAATGDNSQATMDGTQPTCDDPGANTLDVWYTFTTGTEPAVLITLTPGAGMTDHAWVVYDACGGNEVYCTTVPTFPELVNVAPGTTYVLRIYSNTVFGSGGEFSLCLEQAPTPAVNDLCSGAASENLAVGSTLTYTGNTAFAQNTEGLAFNSLWHTIVLASCADVTIDLCGSPTIFNGFFRAIWTTCPSAPVSIIWAGSYNSTECPDGNPTLCYSNLPAGTYYVPVASYGGEGVYELHITAEACGTHRAVNDECDGAIAVPSGTWCNPSHFAPTCATQSLPGVDCGIGGTVANDDVWYTFTATQSEMTLGVQPASASATFFPVVQVFDGNCGSLTPLACADNGDPVTGGNTELALSGLSIGTEYRFRVYNGWFGTPLDDASYDLCVVEGTGIDLGSDVLGGNAATSNVYPNPNNGDFSVRVDARSARATITIIDATGRMVLVRTERNTANGSVQVHAEGKLAHGFYTVRVDDGRTVSATRLIVE